MIINIMIVYLLLWLSLIFDFFLMKQNITPN
jgi:hypothetical protein